MNSESKLNNAIRNNPEIEKFINLVDSKFKVQKRDVKTMIHKKAISLSNYDAFKLQPEQYIEWAIECCWSWLKQERREIKANDVIYYEAPYLYFQAIERK